MGLGLYGPAYDALNVVTKSAGPSPVVTALLFDVIARGGAGTDVMAKASANAEASSGDPDVWLGLARVCARMKDMPGERKALDRAFELAPDRVQVLMQRSGYFERQGDPVEAGKVYQRLAELLPDDPAVCNNLAYNILQTGGDAKRALDLAQQAHAKLTSNPRVLHTLGLAQLRTGNLEDGRKNLTIALEQQPADPTILLDVGQLLIAQEKADEGRKYIEMALLYAGQLGLKFDRRAEAEALLSRRPGA